MTIKNVLCVCGQGLGSSFMVEMNVQKVLKKLGLANISVAHGAAGDVVKGVADLFVVGQDMYDTVKPYGEVVVLRNIVSLPELEEKLVAYFKEKGVL